MKIGLQGHRVAQISEPEFAIATLPVQINYLLKRSAIGMILSSVCLSVRLWRCALDSCC